MPDRPVPREAALIAAYAADHFDQLEALLDAIRARLTEHTFEHLLVEIGIDATSRHSAGLRRIAAPVLSEAERPT